MQQKGEICTQTKLGWPLSAANERNLHSDLARVVSECRKAWKYALIIAVGLSAVNQEKLHPASARVVSGCSNSRKPALRLGPGGL